MSKSVPYWNVEWATLKGHAIKRVKGSAYAALPVTGKKNSRVFAIFKVSDLKELLQLKKNEVDQWLIAKARDEKVTPSGYIEGATKTPERKRVVVPQIGGVQPKSLKKNPKKYVLKNPLKKGYSKQTITANILEMRAAGVPMAQAQKRAYEDARKAWRKKHPKGQYPAHLKVLKKAANKNPRFKTGRKSAPKRTRKTHRGIVEQDTSPSYVIETKGKHAGIIKQNPTPGRIGRAVTKAIKLYQDFTGHDPKFVDEWALTLPDAAMQVGKVTGIMYTTRMDGKQQEFLHEFSGRARPILAASADGRQLLILGGDYHFSDRGIIDGKVTLK